ncbi:MAG: glycogen/starch synthase, partial [Myxococcales bacterium]
MRVFMLGWEFPPFISGGLGTACYGLTKAMSSIGTDILFVLPRPVSTPFSTHLKLVSPRAGSPLTAPPTEFRLDEFERVTFRTISAAFGDPYQTAEEYEQWLKTAEAAGAAQGDKAYVVQKPGEETPVKPAAAPKSADHYGGDLFNEVQRYAALAAE